MAKKRLLQSASIAALIGLSITPSLAQDATTSAGTGEEGISDIVVTAQKRGENLQNVPISITAFSAASLQSAGIKGVLELAQATPGMIATQSGGLVQPFLRGIGNPVNTVGNESSTAIYVDGVYYSRLPYAFFQFDDVERIEVLKGPQGTLFGRNASGGLIHLITRDPGRDPAMKVSVGYSNYETITGSAFVGGPLTDKISASVSAYYNNRGKGWGRSITTGRDAFFEKVGAVRGKIIIEPDDLTKIKISGDYISSKSDMGASVVTYPGTTVGTPVGFSPNVIYQPLPGKYDLRTDHQMARNDRAVGASLNVTRDTDFGQLMSLTAYRKDKGFFTVDQDNTPISFLETPSDYFSKQFTQEFQFTLPKGEVFDAVLGLFYLNSRAGYNPLSLVGPQLGGAQIQYFGTQIVDSYAAYGQGTFHLTPSTNITGGLRYTIDNVEGRGHNDTITPAGVRIAGATLNPKDKFKKLTYKVSVDQEIGANAMIYASTSLGYKAGTFTTAPLSTRAAQPEILYAYEAGFKSMFLDRHVRLNGSVYYYDLKDPQVAILIGSTTTVLNAESARVKGAELELEVIPVDGLTIRANGAYTDAKYKKFTNAPSILPNPDPTRGGNITVPISADASGNHMVRSPKYTANLGGNYTVSLGSMTLDLDANYAYNGGFYWSPDNFLRQKSYSLLNAGIGLRSEENGVGVRVWGRNLTKAYYFSSVNLATGSIGTGAIPASPRTYGVTLNAQF